MSRETGFGVNPESGEILEAAWGWDEVPGFKPGYFFQIFKYNPTEDEEVCLVNEGFLEGISLEKIENLKSLWKVRKTRYTG